MDERALRHLIATSGGERLKVEYKRALPTPDTASKLAREVAAIANTGRPSQGFVFIGAKPSGEIVGGVELLGDERARDGLLRNILGMIDPPPRVDWATYKDATVGWFGALCIHASPVADRPHFIARTSDGGEPKIRRGEILVRRGPTVDLAVRSEVEQLYRERYGLELDALRGRAPGEPEVVGLILSRFVRPELRDGRAILKWEPGVLHRSSYLKEADVPRNPDGAERVKVTVQIGGQIPLEPPWRWSLQIPNDLGRPMNAPRPAAPPPFLPPMTVPRPDSGYYGPSVSNSNGLHGSSRNRVLHTSKVPFDDEVNILVWSDAPAEAELTWEVEAANLRVPQTGSLRLRIEPAEARPTQ